MALWRRSDPRPWRFSFRPGNEKGSQMASLACGKFCGDTSPRGFRIALGEEQCKENRRGGRYEGHDEREAGREKQEAAGAGAPGRSSTPASKDGSPGTPACERASRGGRIAQDRTWKALTRRHFIGTAEAVPFQSNESRSARCPRSTPRPTPSVVGTPVLFAKVGRAENGALNNHPKESSVSAEDRASLAVRLRCLGVRCEGNRGERGYGGTGRSFTPSLSRRSKPSVLADRGSKSA
jgi:hypothetical protein